MKPNTHPIHQIIFRWFVYGGLFLCLPLLALAQDTPQAQVRPIEVNLRVRDVPLEAATIVGYLAPQTNLTVLSRTGDSLWLEVEGGGVQGWVDAAFIRLNIPADQIKVNPDYAIPLDAARWVSNITPYLNVIFARGQAVGKRAGVFSKIGDSITVAPHSLKPIGEGLYHLSAYTTLQPTIDFYSATLARTQNSFANESVAAKIGWTTAMLLDPRNAPSQCQWGENALLCEYRLVRPSVALILFGTNDVEVLSPYMFQAYLAQIVQLSLDEGVIPILSTVPPRPGFENGVNALNGVITDLARAYGVPLIDTYSAMLTLPEYGLDVDRVHPNIPPRGYAGAADFSTPNLQYGYVIRNLLQLYALDAVRRTVIQE